MAERKSVRESKAAGDAGGMSVDDLFELQSKLHVKGMVEPVDDDGANVKVTPWLPVVGCLCQLAFTLPKAAIESVEPTSETRSCCGKTLQIVEINFKEGETIPVTQVFEQLAKGGLGATLADTRAPQAAGAPYAPATLDAASAAGARRSPQNTCICDHFIRRFCQGGQLYEEYWCYDETGAFCGTQVVPLGLSCFAEAQPLAGTYAGAPRGGGGFAAQRFNSFAPSRRAAGAAAAPSFAGQWSGYITLTADDGTNITFYVGCFGEGPYTVNKSQIVSINQVGICGNYGAYYAVINF